MQWFSLVTALIVIVNILPCVVCASVENETNEFASIHASLSKGLPPSEHDNVTTALTEVKTLLQEAIKTQRENAKESQSEIMTFLQEVNNSLSELKIELQYVKKENENVTKSQSKVNTFLREMKSEVANIKQQNSESLTKIMATLDTMNSKKNCAEFRALGDKVSGVRTVFPEGPLNPKSVLVFCDQLTDGGGWTVIRNQGVPDVPRLDFRRSWQDYARGFGDLEGEFWMGLDDMHALTSSTPMQLRVDIETWKGAKRWAKYSTFRIGDPESKFLLSVGGYTGNQGEGRYGMSQNNGSKFSTRDQDNDSDPSVDCAKEFQGGWWFHGCGKHFREFWYSVKRISLKIRPV